MYSTAYLDGGCHTQGDDAQDDGDADGEDAGRASGWAPLVRGVRRLRVHLRRRLSPTVWAVHGASHRTAHGGLESLPNHYKVLVIPVGCGVSVAAAETNR